MVASKLCQMRKNRDFNGNELFLLYPVKPNHIRRKRFVVQQLSISIKKDKKVIARKLFWSCAYFELPLTNNTIQFL